ncbi:glycosyl transferase family 9 [Pirellula staleyi DSM 6068]|uniref:Glycosyl transferase family 9 n=1 Tax=Pirellula staleyi (strain ATCC 27377 / DSM 6068 / ICPB 4128) TaxID=530564 RepID=D2R0J3_PIRSD|nr:glycosyl transferase family 9 [Pirellula staleyi DSM 6068]
MSDKASPLDDSKLDMPSLRVLITRLSAIGDCVLTLPLACAIRDAIPGAQIIWAAEPAGCQLLEGHSAIDHLVKVPKNFFKSPSALWKLRRTLHDLAPQLAIDPQGLTKSSLLGWLSGAQQRIGAAAPWGRELSTYFNNFRVRCEKRHIVDRTLELLLPLGVKKTEVRFDLPRYHAAEASMANFLSRDELYRGYAVLNVGAGWQSKLWPADRYASVARHLLDAWNLPSLVTWSGAEEKQAAEQVVQLAQGAAIMAPDTSLTELATLLRPATVLVGSDTGPMHLAAALGVRVVALHGSTRREESGPYGPANVAIQAYFQSGTSRERRSAQNDAMRAIEASEVQHACDMILSTLRARPAAVA